MKTRYLVIYEHSGMFVNDATLASELRKHGIEFEPLPITSDHIDSIGFVEVDMPPERLEASFRQIRDDGELRGGEIDVYPIDRRIHIELQAG